MEKVWEELRKIEAQAEEIRREAEKRAKEITNFSKQEAEQLIVKSKKYAQEEAQKLQKSAIEEASRTRAERLTTNEKNIEELQDKAQERMPQAERIIVDAVLGKRQK